MFAIYKRELKSYFRSFIGFLFIAVTLFFIGMYFSIFNLIRGLPYFSYAISGVAFLFLLSVPVLTMRVMAEEKKSKTDQLILTAPVSVGNIVLGKFLALITVFLIPVAIACVYPLIMSRFGTVAMGEAYLAIFSYFLYGMTAIAIGLLISSLTESQVIAAVLSFVVLFVGYMMKPICLAISSTGNLLTKVLSCFDLHTPFGEMLNGTLNIEGVVYYITLTVLALYLTAQTIQKRRYSVSVKQFALGAYSTGMIVLSVAIAVVLNVIVGEMPSTWTAIDLTQEKLYTLTDQTKEYVKNMQEDVTIYALVNEKKQDVTLQQTLERYDDLSDHITVEYVDPTVNPQFFTQYTDASLPANSLIVVSDKRSKIINYSMMYKTAYSYESMKSSTAGYDGEGQITSALDYVLSDSMPKIYMTEGHGEGSLSANFTAGLEKANMDCETINLMDYDTVPEDATGLIINGAGSDFSVDDKDKVIAYLEKGGKVVLVTRYVPGTEMPNLDAIMEYMGMSVAEGVLVDDNKDNFYEIPYFLLPTVETSSYTAGIKGKYYIFAPFSQGIMIQDEAAEGMEYSKFLTTSDEAFSKVAADNVQNVKREEGDIEGPFAVGVSAVKQLSAGEATLVVLGCQQIFTDDANTMVSGANLTLFTNIVGSFGGHESNISIPVKDYEMATLMVPKSSVFLIAPIVTIFMPLALLAAGFVIWFRRRRR